VRTLSPGTYVLSFTCATEQLKTSCSCRWPDLEAYRFPVFGAPCPRCTAPYEEVDKLHHHAFHVYHDDPDAFDYYFSRRSRSPSPSCTSSSTGSSRCSSVSSSEVDENDRPPLLFHGDSDDDLPLDFFDGDADLSPLDFPSSTHSDASDAESTEYVSLQDDNLDDDSSADELESTADETDPSIDFEAELQEAKRARELERAEFERRGWGDLSNEPREFGEEDNMDWEWQQQEEFELLKMDRRPEGPLWVEGYAYDYGNGWLWAPNPMQAYHSRPRYGGWDGGSLDEEQSWAGEWERDARAPREDCY
jgi:hypothetical protein